MAKSTKGSRYHPANISGHQKMLNRLAFEEMTKKNKKSPLKTIDISKNNWSLK